MGEAYSSSYAALCAGTFPAMREALGHARGRSLLDVGSGDGTLVAAWSDAGWAVTACEPEETMRSVSRRRLPPVAPVAAALPDLPFADRSFDVAVANFVLNHVASPRAAAAELGRVSRACVVATIWTHSPSWFWAEIVARAGVSPHEGAGLPAAQDFERTTEGLASMLAEAGLHGIRTEEIAWIWSARPNALWRSVEGAVAGAGALYAALDADDRARFRDAFDQVIDERRVDDTVPLLHRAAIAVCLRP